MTIDTSKMFIILSMIFCHIVDDYYLQGVLASMKQKSWWYKSLDKRCFNKHKHDYMVALIMHSFSWAFMIMLPLAIVAKFQIGTPFSVVFAANVIIHAYTDNLKANELKINLVQDQTIHMLQVLSTAGVLL